MIYSTTTSYDTKNPDQEPQIEELGYNPETAKSYALQALKYECFTDFTSPCACETGHAAECFYAFSPDFDEWSEGVKITSDEIKKAGKFPD